MRTRMWVLLPPFKLVSNSDEAPAQSCSQALITDTIQHLYTKLIVDAVNKNKKHLKINFSSSLHAS